MREIMLTALTERKDKTGVSYERISNRIEQKRGTYISVSKLQRIFTGQSDPTVQDFEMIAEDGLEMNLFELYAKIGKQELEASEEVDYKGAHALLEDFAAEKAMIHANYKTNIEHLMAKSDERQKAFTDALNLIGDQYKKNADYLTGIIRDNEAYIRDLLAKTEHSNAISLAAQKRAEEAEKRADEANERADAAELENRTTRKKMYMLFSGMLFLVVFVVVLLALGIVLDLPTLGMGNG